MVLILGVSVFGGVHPTQPLANARRYGYEEICDLLVASGGFVKVRNSLAVVLVWFPSLLVFFHWVNKLRAYLFLRRETRARHRSLN